MVIKFVSEESFIEFDLKNHKAESSHRIFEIKIEF